MAPNRLHLPPSSLSQWLTQRLTPKLLHPTAISSPNPDLATWIQQDQLVVSYITTTLTKNIVSITIGCDTAKEVWECFQRLPKP